MVEKCDKALVPSAQIALITPIESKVLLDTYYQKCIYKEIIETQAF
jgi:hypothetical protein